MTRVAVAAATPTMREVAARLAQALGLPLVSLDEEGGPGEEGAEVLLVQTPERLELRNVGAKTGPVWVDFVSGRTDLRRRTGGGRGQPLGRAVGLKGGVTPTVLDATAGLGRDAFVFASLGCTVTLVERSPVIAALLADGLERAAADPEVGSIVARMSLRIGDASEVMGEPGERPEVIYLDPMYPHTNKSALQKKEMRLFRKLVGDDLDAPQLLEASLARAPKRVVVKRPKSAPPLKGSQPDAEVRSKNTRYDLYFPL